MGGGQNDNNEWSFEDEYKFVLTKFGPNSMEALPFIPRPFQLPAKDENLFNPPKADTDSTTTIIIEDVVEEIVKEKEEEKVVEEEEKEEEKVVEEEEKEKETET